MLVQLEIWEKYYSLRAIFEVTFQFFKDNFIYTGGYKVDAGHQLPHHFYKIWFYLFIGFICYYIFSSV